MKEIFTSIGTIKKAFNVQNEDVRFALSHPVNLFHVILNFLLEKVFLGFKFGPKIYNFTSM